MWQGSDILDRFDCQAGGLKRGNGAFTSAARSLDLDIHFFHARLDGFFGRLLCGRLTGKGGTFSAALETAGAGSRPTERIALCIRNRDGRIVKARLDVSDPDRYATTCFSSF